MTHWLMRRKTGVARTTLTVWIRISEPLNNPHWKGSGNSIHSILEVLKNYLDKLLSKFPELISFWSLAYLGDLPHPQFPTFQEKEAKGSSGVVTRKYKQRGSCRD